LLAWQFAQWLANLEPGVSSPESGVPSPGLEAGSAASGSQSREDGIQIVEAGAHQAHLAKDILNWLRDHRPELFRRLEYLIVEPSKRRQEWQRQTLEEFADRVRWASALSELSAVQGVIFSNELLDAMPVRRMGWGAGKRCWFEWGVTGRAGQFNWTRLRVAESPPAGLPDVPPELAAVLPDGFTIELCPAADDWWRRAAGALKRGKLMTIDYGFAAGERLLPERSQGTLRAYRRHQVSADVLADPGLQDITAHIDFGHIQHAGEQAGLITEYFGAQDQFLVAIAAQIWRANAGFGDWSPQRRRQFHTLTHPDHLGRAFRVLIQAAPGKR